VTTSVHGHRLKSLLWAGLPILLVAILRPWTIRPIERTTPAGFEPGSFAASAWPRLSREASQTAVDVAELTATARAASSKARFVKGAGTVSAIDRQSRAGLMRVQLAGAKPGTVAIQIGPVIRGTALRDAASFIQFSDFINQFDYAAAANALNDYALRTVIASASLETVQGRPITFVGAVGKTAAGDGTLEIVPILLEVPATPGR
jgi:predicted lipoprotein